MESDSINEQQLLPIATRWRTAAAAAATTAVWQHTEHQQLRQQHSACINACYYRHIIRRTAVSIIPGILDRNGTRLWNRTAPNKKRRRTRHTKKNEHAGDRTTISRRSWSESYIPAPSLSFSHDTCQIDMYLYARIDTRDRKCKFDQRTKTTPVAGRRRQHGRGRLRQSREIRSRWGTSSKHHTECWKSRPRALTAQNLV